MDFYAKQQKTLLAFVNSQFGREYLKIENKHKAVIVTPNSIHYYLGKNLYQAEFRTYNFIDRELRPYIEIAHNERQSLLKDPFSLINSIHLATFNPNADGSGTGRLQSSNSTWANARTTGSGINLNNSIAQCICQLSAGTYTLDRDFAPFHTNTIPAAAKIIAATFSITGSADSNNADSVSLEIVQSTQPSATSLGTGTSDWQAIGSTSFGAIAKTSWNQSGANIITLNASGIANISKSSYSQFALIEDRDLNNSAPTGVNDFGISSSSSMVLTVTYAATGGSFLLNFV